VSCAIASNHCGLDIVNDDISALFNEELGCVIQVSNTNKAAVINAFTSHPVDFDLSLNQSVAIHSLWSCPIAG
jgi:phosphoribosylformylglycinamidine (FGAM) synthase-like enzyme